MKAIILASGIGSRLKPLTNSVPKSLISIGTMTILDSQIEGLLNNGIDDIIITTGPFENSIKSHISSNFPDANVHYVNNPKFKSTNYIYSLWLTRNLIDDDILLLHGDLLVDNSLFKKIISSNGNCVLVNKNIVPPEKDFKAFISDSRILKIGVDLNGENTFFSAPFYKFIKKDFLRWIKEIGSFVDNNFVDVYAEEALNNITKEINLHALFYSDEICVEIDTQEDLGYARQLMTSKI